MKINNISKLKIAAAAISAAYAALYFGLGAAIFKNMWNTSPALPIIGSVIAVAPLSAVLSALFLIKNNSRQIAICLAAIYISPVLGLAHFLFFAFVLGKLTYFLIAGLPYFITAAAAATLAFFIFAFPRLTKTGKRVSAITLSAAYAAICLTALFNLTPFYFTAGATVFAVDDEYQIAFSTSHQSVGSVEIGGYVYYDQSGGVNNVSRLHKITVEAATLDEAGGYTIRAQGVALNTAYLPAGGVKMEKTFSFRPVDESDGLQIYNLSDTHECIAGPARAAGWFGDKLDLLILNGDIINDVSSQYQISLIYKLAYRITGGARPVLYTRGNHECNGSLAARFGDCVGCADRGFYYTYRVGTTLSLLVLDTASDLADDSALVRPVANFDTVREQESEWLQSLGDWTEGCDYGFVVAHMAYPLSGYVSESCSWSGWARELVSLTESAQLAICGHSHKTDYILPDTDDNPLADFPVLRGSLRSNKYTDREGVSPFEFTGTAIEIEDGVAVFTFTNARGQALGRYKL